MWHAKLLVWYRNWWDCYNSEYFKILTWQIRVPQHNNTCGSLTTNRHTGQWGDSEGRSRKRWSSYPPVGRSSTATLAISKSSVWHTQILFSVEFGTLFMRQEVHIHSVEFQLDEIFGI